MIFYNKVDSSSLPVQVDFQPTKEVSPWSNCAHRISRSLFPFLGLYKPFGQVAALGVGGVRFIFALNSLNGGSPSVPIGAYISVLVETAALAGTIFAHPVGMMIISVRELGYTAQILKADLDAGKYIKAMESGSRLLNHALYLVALTSGGLYLKVASLTLQMMLGLYTAEGMRKGGFYIDAVAHLGMVVLLGTQVSQLASQIQASNKQSQVDLLERASSAKEVENKVATVRYKKMPNTAQYGGSDYSNAIRVERGITLETAHQIADSDPKIAYFFHMKGVGMDLMGGEDQYLTEKDPLGLVTRFLGGRCRRSFDAGDAVFFEDESKMWLGSAPQSTTFVKLPFNSQEQGSSILEQDQIGQRTSPHYDLNTWWSRPYSEQSLS